MAAHLSNGSLQDVAAMGKYLDIIRRIEEPLCTTKTTKTTKVGMGRTLVVSVVFVVASPNWSAAALSTSMSPTGPRR